MYQYYLYISAVSSHGLIIVQCRNNIISKMSTQLFNALLHSVTVPPRLSQAEYCHEIYEELLNDRYERMFVALVLLLQT